MKNNETCWLSQYLSDHSTNLNNRLINLEEKVRENILPFVQLTDFTDHGVKHAQKVKEKLAILIPKKMRDPLTPFEIFCLFCAALLHDIGMVVKKSPCERDSQIRVEHYIRSREFVIDNHKEIDLTAHEAAIIGELCRAHGMENLSYLEREDLKIEKHGRVRVPLLSAFLRLADALDITSDRAPDIVCENRIMPVESRKYWEMHKCITAVEIQTAPSWDIRIITLPKKRAEVQLLYELRNKIQNELDTIYPVLRSEGIFFKKIELVLNQISIEESEQKVKNPFILLEPFESKKARLFAGRDKEIQQMIERILGRKLVVLIGESGVGKTSLVEAGVIPELKKYGFRIVRFSLQGDPIKNLIEELYRSYCEKTDPMDLIGILRKYFSKRKKDTKLLIIGDHLEQMFTIHHSNSTRIKFIEQLSCALGSLLHVTFLFCIREDYLPDLCSLSDDIPDLYNKDNTFRLHRLSKENGIDVLKRASQYARVKISDQLINRIAEDLCNEGKGMIYPPSLQIVGHRLYATSIKRKSDNNMDFISEDLYDNLGKVETIVNHYFEGILDQYSSDDKSIVGQILSKMVTDYYTKKRVKKEELQKALPECHDLDKLLSGLVDHRIVLRSLGEYELMHDFLAKRVIKLIEKKKFLSPPVRKAIDFIEKNYPQKGLTSAEIAKGGGVSQMHLAFLFRKELGKTINKKLNEIRIGKAKKLLKSRERLMDVAKMTGFKCLSTFSRKFKEIEGQSPLEYRKTFIRMKLE